MWLRLLRWVVVRIGGIWLGEFSHHPWEHMSRVRGLVCHFQPAHLKVFESEKTVCGYGCDNVSGCVGGSGLYDFPSGSKWYVS